MSSDAQPTTQSTATIKLYSALIFAASFLIPAILVVRMVLNFRHPFFLTHVEGVWLTCAYDLLHGTFYRPLFSSLGYGGTRYFPLYFLLTAALAKLFGSLITSALALSAVSIALMCGAAYFALRRLSVPTLLIAGGLAAILAAATTQQALVGAKGDTLAAALSLWGLVLCLNLDLKLKTSSASPRSSPRLSLYLAALFFALAFAAKLTTVFGVAAVVLSWTFARRYKEAVELAVVTACGYIVVVLAMYLGSDGRIFAIFRACASGGGSLSYRLQAPLHLLSKALEVDPLILLILIPAAAFGLAAFRDQLTEILPVYFALALLVTIVIFGSPGIGINHLLDLHVASALLLVISISRLPQPGDVGAGILAFCLLAALGPTAQDLHGDLHRHSIPADAKDALAHVPVDNRPVLAENPVVVLTSGKAPYLLDPFMFRILADARPELAKDFWVKMNHRDFAAIILDRDPASAVGKAWYTSTHFGGEFLQDLEANYSCIYEVGQLHVCTPK
jgi:hypothetical protein